MPLFSLVEMWAKSLCSRVTQFPEMLKPRGKSQSFYFDECCCVDPNLALLSCVNLSLTLELG